jgi:nucleoside-diphosphate-sugar epimerase
MRSLSEDGRMRVAVTGATGVIGRAAVRSLVGAGHDVVAMVRDEAGATAAGALGARTLSADLFDLDSLVRLYDGCEAAINLATHIPVGYAAALPWSWRVNDRLRTEGVRNVVAAAHRTGVRRVVQESVSFVYADHGEDWITEQHPIDITPATEPVAVSESLVQDYANGPRVGVVLRLGTIVGDDGLTGFQMKAVRHGRPVGLGRPDAWSHVVHTDDLGPAVLAALHAPSGVYNVGAEPVRRRDLVAGYASAAGVAPTGYLGPVLRRLAGRRVEPLTRSLRICSEHYSAQTGWAPTRPVFGPDWFDCWRARAAKQPT